MISVPLLAQYSSSDWNYIVPYSDQEMIDRDINKRNLLFFRVESSEDIRFQGEPIKISDIREIVKVYVKNEKDSYDLPKPLYRSRYEDGKTIIQKVNQAQIDAGEVLLLT